jgi:hypothetical protein
MTMRNVWFVLAVIVLLAGLPIVVWLDMRHLSEKDLQREAEDFSKVVGLVRDFYSSEVVSRIVDNDGKAVFSHKFREIPGGVPVPATFSLELAELLKQDTLNLSYRFLSDYPFYAPAGSPAQRLRLPSPGNFQDKRQERNCPVFGRPAVPPHRYGDPGSDAGKLRCLPQHPSAESQDGLEGG